MIRPKQHIDPENPWYLNQPMSDEPVPWALPADVTDRDRAALYALWRLAGYEGELTDFADSEYGSGSWAWRDALNALAEHAEHERRREVHQKILIDRMRHQLKALGRMLPVATRRDVDLHDAGRLCPRCITELPAGQQIGNGRPWSCETCGNFWIPPVSTGTAPEDVDPALAERLREFANMPGWSPLFQVHARYAAEGRPGYTIHPANLDDATIRRAISRVVRRALNDERLNRQGASHG